MFTSASANVYSARHNGQRTGVLLLTPIGSVTLWSQRGHDEIDIKPPEFTGHIKFSTGIWGMSTILFRPRGEAHGACEWPVFAVVGNRLRGAFRMKNGEREGKRLVRVARVPLPRAATFLVDAHLGAK